MTDLVVIGSLNIDLVVAVPLLPKPGETVAGPNAEHRPGGKGANQACAAARLGANVRLAGLVGDDAFGPTCSPPSPRRGWTSATWPR